MALFGLLKRKREGGLSREQALSARPVLNQLVTREYNAEGQMVLNVPRRRTGLVRSLSKAFKLPPHKQIQLDELGTFTLELCDGSHTVSEIVKRFAARFKLGRREAEVSMVSYMGNLVRRGIISLAVTDKQKQRAER